MTKKAKTDRGRGDVGVADYLEAAQALSADERQRAWLAGMLGMRLESAEPAGGRDHRTRNFAPPPSISTGAARHDEPDVLHDDPRLVHDDSRQRSVAAVQLERRSDPAADAEPVWLRGLEPLPEERPEHVEFRPPHQPLLVPRWTRGILSAALATGIDDGPLDVDVLIAESARGRPILELPRCIRPTLGRGVWLYVDFGAGLLPFRRDQLELIEQVERLVTRARVQVRRFADNPLRGSGPGARSTWTEALELPPEGTPVLLLTDLGIAQRRMAGVGARPSEWIEFAERVAAAGCPLVALVPYARHRVPRELRALVEVLSWSETTTINTLRRRLR